MKTPKLVSALVGAAVLVAAFSTSASAGSFILSGTDADDHGFANGSGNQDGWLYMQKALENISTSTGLTNGNKTVVNLGSSGGTALAAATSAFSLSSLVSAGWNFVNIDSVSALTDFFNGMGGTNINNAGILMMDSGSDNVFGGSDLSERSVFTTFASTIDGFLNTGGGLFSQSNGYGFLSALIPGAIAVDEFDTGISLTAAGNTAFPGLTNADLGSGPYHNAFANFGAVPVLGTSDFTGNAIIIGASAGSITNPGGGGTPTSVPEPTSAFGLLVVGALGAAAKRKKQTVDA